MSERASILVRPFVRADVLELLGLMRALAVFEDYIDAFAVTEADLVAHGLGQNPRFGVLVAEREGALVGMAVHYVIPWTYDLKPTLVLKELYVDEVARGLGVGRLLIEALAREAVRIGTARIGWGVMRGNAPAELFYASLGGQPDDKFAPWSLDAATIARLADAG